MPSRGSAAWRRRSQSRRAPPGRLAGGEGAETYDGHMASRCRGFVSRTRSTDAGTGPGDPISRCSPEASERRLAYDGPNVLSVGNLEILHGGGVDDPLIMFPSGPGALCGYPAAYFHTHQGRLYFFYGAESATDCTGKVLDWQFSGAIVRSDGFDLSRQGEDETGLSYFRNRW